VRDTCGKSGTDCCLLVKATKLIFKTGLHNTKQFIEPRHVKVICRGSHVNNVVTLKLTNPTEYELLYDEEQSDVKKDI